MFTGIVERMGRVVAVARRANACALEIETDEAFTRELALGASVAVDGCCLTVIARDAGRLTFEAVPETLERTALGDRVTGSRVHLERALRAGGRLDGHIVQGHIDGCGVVQSLERQQEDVRLGVGCSPEIAGYLAPKGSVAIDGVSLTVVDVQVEAFSVALIPHTVKVTHLGSLQVADRVNLEVDILGKYVHHFLSRARASAT